MSCVSVASCGTKRFTKPLQSRKALFRYKWSPKNTKTGSQASTKTRKRVKKLSNRPVHAPECIMGNQGKMERNSKVCVEVQNDEKYS